MLKKVIASYNIITIDVKYCNQIIATEYEIKNVCFVIDIENSIHKSFFFLQIWKHVSFTSAPRFSNKQITRNLDKQNSLLACLKYMS